MEITEIDRGREVRAEPTKGNKFRPSAAFAARTDTHGWSAIHTAFGGAGQLNSVHTFYRYRTRSDLDQGPHRRDQRKRRRRRLWLNSNYFRRAGSRHRDRDVGRAHDAVRLGGRPVGAIASSGIVVTAGLSEVAAGSITTGLAGYRAAEAAFLIAMFIV